MAGRCDQRGGRTQRKAAEEEVRRVRGPAARRSPDGRGVRRLGGGLVDRIRLRAARRGDRRNRRGDRCGVQDRRASELGRSPGRQPRGAGVARAALRRRAVGRRRRRARGRRAAHRRPRLGGVRPAGQRRSCPPKQVARVEISTADHGRPLRPRRRRRGPPRAGRGVAGTAQRDPAAATADQIRADDRAAQPDPAGPDAAVLLRPQSVRLGPIGAAGRRREPEPGQAGGVRGRGQGPAQRTSSPKWTTAPPRIWPRWRRPWG